NNRDSSIISSSSKIDSLLDEFAGELTLLKPIPPGIDKTECHPENEIRLSQRLLYDNSSPRPPEEFVFENSNAEIESFSPSHIPIEDSDSFMEEIDLFLTPDDPMPPSIEDDDNDSKGDNLFLERLLHDDPIPLSDTLDFSNVVRVFLPFFTYPVKENQEKDKIGTKPNKNGKRGPDICKKCNEQGPFYTHVLEKTRIWISKAFEESNKKQFGTMDKYVITEPQDSSDNQDLIDDNVDGDNMNAHRIDDDNVDGDNMNVDGINNDNVDDDTVNVDGVSHNDVDVGGGVHGGYVSDDNDESTRNDDGTGVAKGSLVNEGFADWAHLTTRLKEHEVGLEHITNMAIWFDMRCRLKKNEAIDNVVHEQFEKERYHWMKVLLRIISIVKFLAKHNLEFRGSAEKLHPLSIIRWESHVETLKAIRFKLLEIKEALLQVADTDNDFKIKSESKSLATNEVGDFEFLVSTIIWYDILSVINFVSKKLQSDDMLIDIAVKEVEKLIAFFEEFRDTGFDKAINVAKEISIEMNIDPVFRQKRVIRRKIQFDENYVDEETTYSVEEAFKVQYFLYIVDQALVSLRTRFKQYKKYERVFGFLFTSGKLNSLDDNTLKSHCSHLEAALKNNEQSDVDAKDLFVEVLLTIPVTVASAERSFSKLKLLKSYLRSTMSQERLNGLALIAIENRLLESVDYEDLINNFASKNARRIALFKK
nr:zinc finger MYM-type protein 1-like [Tanacetum cinerariifolium]